MILYGEGSDAIEFLRMMEPDVRRPYGPLGVDHVGLNLPTIVDSESYRPRQFGETIAMLHGLGVGNESDRQTDDPGP